MTTHHLGSAALRVPSASRSTGGALAGLVLAAAALVAACGGASVSPGSTASPPPSGGAGTGPAGLDGRVFISSQVTVDGRPHGLVPGTQIRLEFRDGRIGASAGCNRLGGRYRLDGDALVVTDAAVTEMGCDPARHAQDEWLFGLLGRGPLVRLDGDELTLRLDTTVITFLDRRVVEPDLPLVGTEWVLDSILSGAVVSSVPAGVAARLRFGADGQVTVETGCNSGGGPYRIDGDRLVFGDLVLTKRACVGPEGQVEAAVLAVLGAGEVRFGIDGSTLRLVAGSEGLDFRGAGLD
jgi:heat shock protein HslJ